MDKQIRFHLGDFFLSIIPLRQAVKVENIPPLKNDLFGFSSPFIQNAFLIQI